MPGARHYPHFPIKSAVVSFLDLSPVHTHGTGRLSMQPLTAPVDCTLPLLRPIRSRNGRRVVRVVLKGVHKVKWRLASGELATYHYAWRGGPRLTGEPGTPEFVRSYTEAHNARKTPTQGLLFTLIAEFRASTDYTQCAVSTKRAYSAYLKLIEAEFGDMPIAALSSPNVRGTFKTWRDSMSATPRAADYAWATLARVLAVATDRGRIPTNPCLAGGRLHSGGRADKIWTEGDIGRLLAVAPAPMRNALMLALWTGQRQGDLLRLPWSSYDGKCVRLRQSKTDRAVTIPAGPTLRTVLEQVAKVGPVILTNQRGLPWTSSGFRASWRKLCAKAGISGLTFHDLRGSAVVRLSKAGATVPEIATFTGHGLKDVEALLDRHYLGRDVQLAENAVRKLERRTKTVK